MMDKFEQEKQKEVEEQMLKMQELQKQMEQLE